MNFVGGLRALEGFQQGRQEELQRQRAEEDRQYQQGQRQHQQQQQQRTQQQWEREDAERTEIATIDPNTPQDVQLRRAAAARRKAGDIKGAIEMHNQADKFALERSEQKVKTILAGSQNMTARQIVEEAARVLNDDPVPGGISNITEDANGGVTIEVQDNLTGQKSTRTFADANATREWLMAYKAPAVYDSLQKLRQAAAAKAQEPYTLKPGEKRMIGDKVVAQGDIPKGYEALTNPDGSTVLRKIDGGAVGGSGSGSGKGGGKAPAQPIDQARELLDTSAQKGEDKLPGDVYARANTYLENLYRNVPNVPPAAAAEVARRVAQDPKLLTPQLNPQTGEFDGVYRDKIVGGGKPFVLARGYMDVKDIERAIEKGEMADKVFLRNAVAEMIPKQFENFTKTVQQDGKTVRVALSPEEKAKLQTGFIEAAHDPRKAAVLIEAAKVAGPEEVAALQRKLELVARTIPMPGAKGEAKKPAGLKAAIDYAPRAGVPQELAERTSRFIGKRNERVEAENKRTQEETAARAADKEKRRKEVEWLTENEVRAMKPSEAQTYLGRYHDVLPPAVVRALTMRQ